MSERIEALRASASHLRDIVTQLESDQHTAPAYPSEWTVADTMSHIGSGAVILGQMLDNAMSGSNPTEGFNQSVWDAWNAKSPAEQIADALVADQNFLDALDATSDEQRKKFQVSFGPMKLDFERFVGMRLGEHVLHTWDVEVTMYPGAVLAVPAAGLLLEQIHFLVARSGKSSGVVRTISVRTHEPARDFNVVFEESSVELVDTTHGGPVDVELPGEAFVRLIYGRLDAVIGLDDGSEIHLEHLRQAFPGF
ncbi:MAG: maleylpyruvate isomerase family mycothiol-dependent enzyme [Acidimicrobiaceae bacterium]|nr:maleylpyruvate isomerase family mycothiol-dependent enzyme [Acidimicrobiaceae bacterium]